MILRKIHYAVLLVMLSCGGGGGGGNPSPGNGSNGGSGSSGGDSILSLIFFETCADAACSEKKLAQMNASTSNDFSLVSANSYNSTSVATDGVEYVNGKVYFSANTIASANYQLWEYDPVAEIEDGVNPKEVSSIAVGDINFAPRDFEAAGNILYFSADTSAEGRELWQYDSSLEASVTNPSLVIDYEPGANDSNPNEIIFHNEKLYFVAERNTDGIELRVYDPSIAIGAGNPAAAETFVGTTSGLAKDLVLVDDKIYFSAWNGPDNGTSTQGVETWVFDTQAVVSASNPSLEIDFEGSALPAGSLPQHFTEVDGFIYFTALADMEGAKLRMYDPSVAVSATNPSTIEIESGVGGSIDPPNIRDMHAIGSKLYFNVEDVANNGDELWVFDTSLPASTSNPSELFDLEAGGGGSLPEILGVYSTYLVFTASTTTYGTEVWIYDSSQPISVGTNPFVIDSVDGATDSIGANFSKNF